MNRKIRIIFIMVLAGVLSVAAMDEISDNEMETVTGSAGVDILFEDIEFGANLNQLTWTDYTGSAYAARSRGYVRLINNAGTAVFTGTIALTLDVATAGASGYTTTGMQLTSTLTRRAVIPANRTYIRLGLTDGTNNTSLRRAGYNFTLRMLPTISSATAPNQGGPYYTGAMRFDIKSGALLLLTH